MASVRHSLYVVTFILCITTIGVCEEPVKVTVCEIKNNPPVYNHKLVEVSGFVSHDFEDFTLFDPTCPSWPAVWLDYGGTSKSGTMYCCGVTADRHRPRQLEVENIPIPFVINSEFEVFEKSIQPPFRSGNHGAVVRATIVGRFFAGKQIKYLKGNPWGGYGHMGCCSMLAIQEIESVDKQDRNDLDYGASPDQPDIEKTECGYRSLLPLERYAALIQSQQEADSGKRAWSFDDPQRVASEALITLTKTDEASLRNMRQTREAQGRKVYDWKAPGKSGTYMIVVNRPYWLSFYSHDPNRVAWVILAAHVSSCGKHNAVTRIRSARH